MDPNGVGPFSSRCRNLSTNFWFHPAGMWSDHVQEERCLKKEAAHYFAHLLHIWCDRAFRKSRSKAKHFAETKYQTGKLYCFKLDLFHTSLNHSSSSPVAVLVMSSPKRKSKLVSLKYCLISHLIRNMRMLLQVLYSYTSIFFTYMQLQDCARIRYVIRFLQVIWVYAPRM